MIWVPGESRLWARRGSTVNARAFAVIGLWAGATLIATFFALIIKDSTIVGDLYIPRTNDSFYHARRILDAALGQAPFYQFDSRIHPPQGTWIPWPWGYDYFMAKLLDLALWLRPDANPMAILVYVPVVWIGINAALFLAAATALRLSGGMRFLVMLAFALSPLTQLLHGIAMIDHHFVEHTFVLLTIWLGTIWLQSPASRGRAIALGAVLGVALAFHNGLFLLQLIPLVTILILWLRGTAPPRASLLVFAGALVVSTLLVVLPSEPFRQGMFAFGYLSWFHLYVSSCTAVVVAIAAVKQFSGRRLAMLAGVSLALVAPLLAQLLLGAAFLSGGVTALSSIAEAQSPWRLFVHTMGPIETISYYSWLLVLVPPLLGCAAYSLATETRPARLYFAAASTLGLSLMLLQFRFYYYGLFPLIAGCFLVCDLLRQRFRWHQGLVFVAALGLFVLAYQPPLRQRLFTIYAIASDPDYQTTMPILLKLGEYCKDDPGLVLANNDDGNAILYHSDCSVIANNFILGAKDEARFDEITKLMKSSPEELLRTDPPIRYLFVRADDFSYEVDGHTQLDTSNRIISEIFLSDNLPPGFELLTSVYVRLADDGELVPHARLYRLTPTVK